MTFEAWWATRMTANDHRLAKDFKGCMKVAWDDAVVAERERLAALVIDVPDPDPGCSPRDAQNVALQIYRRAIREGK